MKFGVREICDVVFKANQTVKIGDMVAERGQPVLYIDSAKTSTIESSATTSYATGGRGNSRLISWEGEKTLTFTVEDALLSPVGFAVLSGAGLFKADPEKKAYVHNTAVAQVVGKKVILNLEAEESISPTAPIFVMGYDKGSIATSSKLSIDDNGIAGNTITLSKDTEFEKVFVDFYVEKASAVTELQIDAENFGGYYYVEASTLFRREEDGKDLPAEIVFPKVKIQSNFTFNMSSTGDPSTFTFTMDAMPGYTMFNKEKKVLCAMQVIDDTISTENKEPVTMGNDKDIENIQDSYLDSQTVKTSAVDFKVGETVDVEASDYLEVYTTEDFNTGVSVEGGTIVDKGKRFLEIKVNNGAESVVITNGSKVCTVNFTQAGN